MAKDWRKVKEEIEKDIDRIWWEEPKEVTMSKKGVYPSGAGTDNQILGNLLFLVADTQGMGWWTSEPAILAAISDQDFSLNHCKKMWKYMVYHMAGLMGEVDPPNCPAPWLNLPKLWQFCKDIVESFDSIKTKEEFSSLIWSWNNYVNRLNWWFFLVFPWELGKAFPRMDKEKIEELSRFHDLDLKEL